GTSMTNQNGNARLLPAVILALGAILAATIFGAFFHSSRASRDTVQVVGAARERFTSDIIKWQLMLARTVDSSLLPSGYAQLRNDVESDRTPLRYSVIHDSAVIVPLVGVNSINDQTD